MSVCVFRVGILEKRLQEKLDENEELMNQIRLMKETVAANTQTTHANATNKPLQTNKQSDKDKQSVVTNRLTPNDILQIETVSV